MSRYIDADKIPYCEETVEWRCHNDRWEEKAIRAYKSDIDRMPPADVAPVVHGRWIVITADVHRCSNCDQLVRTKDIVPYRFCNVCGAKMDESGDEE